MIPHPMSKKKRIITNFQVHLPPWKKCLLEWVKEMQEIIIEVKKGGVQFIDHTTSLLRVLQ
jgi:hypothetical protein